MHLDLFDFFPGEFRVRGRHLNPTLFKFQQNPDLKKYQLINQSLSQTQIFSFLHIYNLMI